MADEKIATESSVEADSAPWKNLLSIAVAKDKKGLEEELDRLGAKEVFRSLSRLALEEQHQILALLDAEDVSELVEDMPDEQAAALVESLSPAHAADIIEEMESAEAADLLGDLDTIRAREIIEEMAPEAQGDALLLTQYADDVAGGLMVREFLSFRENLTVGDVLRNLREHAEEYRTYKVQYAYVVSRSGKLKGVLVLRDIVLESEYSPISEVMRTKPASLLDLDTLETVDEFFRSHNYLAAPVTNADGTLLGVITREALEEAVGERAEDVYLKAQGIVGGEEFRSMPLMLRSRRRLSWLSVNIVLNVIAASVIAYYEETLASVIALAVFLPIISDMSGCSGNQAVAVTMRELTLGLIRPVDFVYVWFQEIKVGVVNGLALGTLIGLLAWAWKGNPYLGLVAGGALAINTSVAVSIGGVVPLVLKRLGMDPALASGPILTTVTDLCGFFFVLSMAAAMLPYLTS